MDRSSLLHVIVGPPVIIKLDSKSLNGCRVGSNDVCHVTPKKMGFVSCFRSPDGDRARCRTYVERRIFTRFRAELSND